MPLHLFALMLIYARRDNRPHIRLILSAVKAAFAGAPKMFRTRREVQKQRRASLGHGGRDDLEPEGSQRRRPVIRPLRPLYPASSQVSRRLNRGPKRLEFR